MYSQHTPGGRYQVIATLGPAISDSKLRRALLAAGATAYRLNTSHLSVQETVDRLELLDRELGPRRPPIVLDLQGSKWRLGATEERVLPEGSLVTLRIETGGTAGAKSANTRSPESEEPTRTADGSQDNPILPVPHPDFFAAARTGVGIVRLNDNKVELEIVDSTPELLTCRVRRGGPVASRKGITLPGVTFRREGLLPKDSRIITETCGHHAVAYALSYVRDAEEMALFRRAVAAAVGGAEVSGYRERDAGGHDAGGSAGRRGDGNSLPRLIAKLERPEAMAAAVEIGARADEIWVCRGDLGTEVGATEMARLVHRFYGIIPRLRVPAVMAGQVLEHMTDCPEPTRSEVCHLHDLLAGGFDGVVLSDEVAVGSHPVAACRTAAQFFELPG